MQDFEIDEKALKRLNYSIYQTYKFDFSNYAVSSYCRRIDRIMKLYNFDSIDQLIRELTQNKAFWDEYLRSITVNTTEMFRDPSFWVALRDVVLPSIEKHNVLRIWHAGCSTGEEIYSMAIMLKEYGIYDRVRIFATDINDKVLISARNGQYTAKNLETHERNYKTYGGTRSLSDYYEMESEAHGRMDRDLLTNVTLKRHDLVQGDVFSKFDLILCRNVIIYFNKVLQNDVFGLFQRSLYADGYLGIGSKESLIWYSDADKFKGVDVENNIYQTR